MLPNASGEQSMKCFLPLHALAAAVLCFATAQAHAEDAPYQIKIWSSVLFNTEGTPADIRIEKEAEYPVKFLDAVKAKIAAAHIDAPTQDGQAARYRTGIRLVYTVTPSAQGASVTLDEFALSPLPLREYYAPYPRSLAGENGWQGNLKVVCKVSAEGMCSTVDVTGVNGPAPEAARKYAKDSMAKWKFEPQTLNDTAIESEFTFVMSLKTDTHVIKDPRRR